MFPFNERIAFYIFGYPITKYGIVMGCAIALAASVLLRLAKKYYKEMPENTIIDIVMLVVVYGILGARLWYVLLDLDYFLTYPNEILKINHGGLTIHGAIIGGVIGGLMAAKIKSLNFYKLADLFAICLPLGQAIGRWGNYFNSEAFGLPCNFAWCIEIPQYARPIQYANFDHFHPTFLYESIADLGIFALLYFLYTKKEFKDKSGSTFYFYLICYSIVRFFIELIRIDSVLNLGGIPVAIIVSVVLLIVGIIGFRKRKSSMENV